MVTDENRIAILDHGYIELQSVSGDDMAIVQAARTSYLGDSKGTVQDKKLLLALMKRGHTTPFEMVQFKFRIKAPILVFRQWMRHRTWSYNEMSRRYSDAPPEFYIPSEWRGQSTDDKQMSDGDAISQTESLMEYCTDGVARYNAALEAGVAREMARMFLPINMYSVVVGSVNAHNLMRFLRLRMDSHAQWEIRQYANAIFEMFKKELPWTAEGFLSDE